MPKTSPQHAREYVVFRVGEQHCGIDIARIHEINRNIPVTRVFSAPPHVRGVINLRGSIVTIIDLAVHLTGQPMPGQGKNVIVQSQGELVGLLVDEVDDIVSPATSRLLPPPPHLDPAIGQHAVGVLTAAENLVIILDPDSIAS